MKVFFYIFPISFFCITTYGQVEIIKVKKEKLTQDKMSSVVTLGGLYDGKCSTLNIYADKHLKISNNHSNFKIVSFDACLATKGLIKCFYSASDSLTNDLMDQIILLDFPQKPKLFIDNIKAVNRKMDTVLLNPINLVLIK